MLLSLMMVSGGEVRVSGDFVASLISDIPVPHVVSAYGGLKKVEGFTPVSGAVLPWEVNRNRTD
jgi:hypothetical protein